LASGNTPLASRQPWLTEPRLALDAPHVRSAEGDAMLMAEEQDEEDRAARAALVAKLREWRGEDEAPRYLLRREKATAGIKLPPKTIGVHDVLASADEWAEYAPMEKEFIEYLTKWKVAVAGLPQTRPLERALFLKVTMHRAVSRSIS
jgi:hypothetical protein